MEDGNYKRESKLQILVALILTLLCGFCTMSQSEFHWQTGKWKTCQHTRCGSGGSKSRALWCAGETGTQVNFSHCLHLHKPIVFMECVKPCPHHKHKVRWSIGPWSGCTSWLHSACLSGSPVFQQRNVTCLWLGNGHQIMHDEICSSFFKKPISKQKCHMNCAQDCVVTEFSEWSSCEKCLFMNRTRTRSVIIPASENGKRCPPLSEMKPCEKCLNTYTFSVGPWSKCKPIDGKNSQQQMRLHHHIGFQEREISCLGGHGRIITLRFCLNVTMLQPAQSCVMPQDCNVSHWLEWAPVSSSCRTNKGVIQKGLMIRKRKVLQVPLGDGKRCPPLEETKEISRELRRLRKCPRTHWIFSDWGHCKPSLKTTPCGFGLQQCTVLCVEEDFDGLQRPLPDSYCLGPKPATSRLCEIECKQNCIVSEWSTWGTCHAELCSTETRRRREKTYLGYRSRSRQIIFPPKGNGAHCDHLVETQPCDPGPCFHWNVTSKGGCYLYHADYFCGSGTRYNTIVCVDSTGKQVLDSLCVKHASKPKEDEKCSIPCSDDCVVSEWQPWSVCPDKCDTSAQVTNRVRHRKILAFSGPGKLVISLCADGFACPPSSDLTESGPCPLDVECRAFAWKTGEWGMCQVEQGSTCGVGKKTRRVTCHSEGHQVESNRCVEALKPGRKQSCRVLCPKDCIMTNYSHWSPCSATCQEAKQAVPTEMRKKYILQQADEGGVQCPAKLVDVRQCMHLPWCDEYVWEVTDWSSCVLPPHIPYCGHGLRGRNVTCKDHRNVTAIPDICMERLGAMPSVSDFCYVPCDDECFLSEWSEFSSCVNGCNGFKFRTRHLLVESKYNSVCKDRLKYPLYEKKPCMCQVLQPMIAGNWSDCIIEQSGKKTVTTDLPESSRLRYLSDFYSVEIESLEMADCGEGRKYKSLACLGNIDGASSADCSKENSKDICIIPCPVDCEMSKWSAWSACNASCWFGIQQRYRKLAKLPSLRGRPCPQLETGGTAEIQTKLCHVTCEEYEWQTDQWSACVFGTSFTCGQGIQTRHVFCVTKGSKTVISYGDQYCQNLPRPSEQQICHIPCAGECVVSDWSSWSLCDLQCHPNQVQYRARKILRTPNKRAAPDSLCPPLTEQQPCMKKDNCKEYYWRFSPWTSCLVNEGYAECGIGKREKYAFCQDHMGTTVNMQHCSEALGEPNGVLRELCEVPCSFDCLLSSWTEWNGCSKTCGVGTTKRHRYVLQDAVGNGRPCSSQLEQMKPCLVHGCFQWDVTEWTPCFPKEGVCGSGVRTRNISCVSEGRTEVDHSNCRVNRSIVTIDTKSLCNVGCPGECVLTEWSTWSDCYLNCEDSEMGQARGVQSRSRAILAFPIGRAKPCPSKLWESWLCHAKSCFSFHWRIGDWLDNRRQVWCGRSDGLKVTGACVESIRPGDRLTCDPPCNVSNSDCVDINVCKCREKYVAHYAKEKLISCDLIATMAPIPTTQQIMEQVRHGKMELWMYVVVSGGTLLVIAAAFGLYTACGLFKKGPRRKVKRSRCHEEQALQNNPDPNEQVIHCNHVPAFIDEQPESEHDESSQV